MLVFGIFAGFGLLKLLHGPVMRVISFFLGSAQDSNDQNHESVSDIPVDVFLAVYGLGGLIAMDNFAASVGTAVVVGTVTGVLAAGLVVVVMRLLSPKKTESTFSSRSVIGVHGSVITPIAGQSYGEVAFVRKGRLIKMDARSDEPMDMGTRVKIVDSLSSTSVKVARLD